MTDTGITADSQDAMMLKPLRRLNQFRRGPKKVSFQIEGDCKEADIVTCKGSENTSKQGELVTFRIAVTKKELKRIMEQNNGARFTSVDEFLQGIDVCSRKITHVAADGGITDDKWNSTLATNSQVH